MVLNNPAPDPKKELNPPVVLLRPAELPKKELEAPVVTGPAKAPKKEFSLAVVLLFPAKHPKKELRLPENAVLDDPASDPTTVLCIPDPAEALFPAA